MPKTTNLTYDELIAIAPKDQKFKIKVQSNPRGRGGEQILKAEIDRDGDLTTDFDDQYNINGVDYDWILMWKDEYKGTFDFIEEEVTKNATTQKGFDPAHIKATERTFASAKVTDVRPGTVLISPSGHKCKINEIVVHYKNLDVGGEYMGAMNYMEDTWQVYLQPDQQKESGLNTEQIDNQNMQNANKGFDPENLTFDGVKIQEGDEIWVARPYTKKVIKHTDSKGNNFLCVEFSLNNKLVGQTVGTFIPLYILNITGHYPAHKKDEELDRLEKEIKASQQMLYERLTTATVAKDVNYLEYKQEAFDCYYQARKNLEEYKSKNNII